jgi:hypothetical protein
MKTQTLDIKVKTHLIKAFCRPVLLYGIEAVHINKGYMTKLKKHEGLLVKRTLGLSKRSRHTKVLMAVGLEPTEQTVEKRKVKFMRDLLNYQYTRGLIELELAELQRNPRRQRVLTPVEEVLDILGLGPGISCDLFHTRCSERLLAIDEGLKKLRKDGMVQSLKYCVDTKQLELLRLLTKTYAYVEFNDMYEDDE